MDDIGQVQPTVDCLEDFLVGYPPGIQVRVSGCAKGTARGHIFDVDLYRFKLHCDRCDGERNFYPLHREESQEKIQLYLDPAGKYEPRTKELVVAYACSDCRLTIKRYSIQLRQFQDSPMDFMAYKYGELPPFGRPLPSRLMTLLRDSAGLLSAARRCESQSLGIGAFAYYRRVIDNQKNKIFDEIIRVVRTIGGDEALIGDLDDAKRATSFTTSVEAIKHALPESLMVKGENPLKLLYGALSAGLHGQTDEQCLARATAIRSVLTSFAERLTDVLQEDKAFDDAVNLLKRSSTPAAIAANEETASGK